MYENTFGLIKTISSYYSLTTGLFVNGTLYVWF